MTAYTNLLTALGWSLLDSVWQMAILWSAYYLLTAWNNRLSAAGKHNLILLFVVFGVEWFVYSFIQLLKSPMDPLVTGFISVSPNANRWIPYLSGLYLSILAGRFIQYGFHYYRRHDHQSSQPASLILQTFTDRYTRILGITKKVHIYLSGKVETAQTVGFIKPLIFLPFSLSTGLAPGQVEAILLHELYHIRRNDYLINIFMTCFRCVFFFNPFACLFTKALERERELACDDGVLELGYEPSLYAEALFSLEKYRQVSTDFSIAADGNRPWLLMERISRVLGKPTQRKKQISPLLFLSLAAAFILFALQGRPILKTWPVSRETVAVIPEHYEVAEEKTLSSNTMVSSYRLIKPNKMIKKKTSPAGPAKTQEFLSTDEPGTPELAHFAEQNIVQNFSNQSGAGAVAGTLITYPATPYIPSVSLYYETHPEFAGQDSSICTEIQDGIREVINVTRLKTIIELNALETQIERNRRELKDIELKNRNFIILDQEKIRPLLKKLHQQMLFKKKEIDKLRIRLQVSEEEIIHI